MDNLEVINLNKSEKFRLGNTEYLVIVIGVILLAVVFYNTIRISDLAGTTGNTIGSILPSVSASEILPSGVPKIYGEELNIKYDDVSANNPQKADATIEVLSNFDRTMNLEGENLQRYINIASRISCEYCCGAESIIFSNGQAACGCAHSYAMRGLAKYLITKHPNEFTDDEILEELGKWKTLFFPGQIQAKAQILSQQGVELNYINLASNKYRGIEQGAAGSGMVGGC